MKALVCWSGGKNSTRAVWEYHSRGYDVTAICYITMFTRDIPLIDKAHYDFLNATAKKFREWGIHVVFLKGVTYYDWCSHILVKGKDKGKPRGFPLFFRNCCGFAQDGKIATLNNYFKKYSKRFHFIDIGLCADEYDRKTLVGKERSILQELNITDLDCFYWCRSQNLLSPCYKVSFRDGCLLCPQAKAIERIKFFNEYPEAFEKVLELQRIAKIRNFYPLRGKHWFIENEEFICGYGSQVSFLNENVIY